MSRATRPITIEGDVAYVPLTRGHVATIDVADVPLIDGRNWSALVSGKRPTVYAVRVDQASNRQTMVLMHRLISGAPKGLHVDHINGDGLDNRRANLRLCTQAENNQNLGIRSDNTSGLKGVSLDKRCNRWHAEIQCSGKRKFLGYFATPQEAHIAYQAAATQMFGKFARAL